MLFFLHLGEGFFYGFWSLVREPKAHKLLTLRISIFNANTNDNFTLAIRVTRIYNGVNVGAVHKGLKYLKLLSYASVLGLFIWSFLDFKFEFFRVVGKSLKGPFFALCTRVAFNISKGEKMTDSPGNQIGIACIKSVAFFEFFVNSRHNISRK